MNLSRYEKIKKIINEEKKKPKKFSIQENKQKNKIINTSISVLNFLSNDEPFELIKSILKKLEFKDDNIDIIKFKDFYNELNDMNIKKDFIEAIKQNYSFNKLKQLGFKLSKNVYYDIYQKKKEKRKKNIQDKIEIIKKFLEKHLKEDNEIYIKDESVIDLFFKFKKENQNISESTFRYYLKNYFKIKNSNNYNDYCNTCYQHKVGKINSEFYQLHINNKIHQKEKFKNQIQNLKKNEQVVVLDFKQNIKLGNNIQPTDEFYAPIEKSVLGFVIYSKENNDIKKNIYHYFSDELTHDSNFVQDCFDDLIEKKIILNPDSLYIYSDCGLHFRNKENIQYFYQLRKRLNNKIFINYFIEGHGKNIVDAQFRVLSSFIKDIRKKSGTKGVFTIDELILQLEEKKNQNEKYQNINYIKINIIKKIQKINFEIQNFLDFYYFELFGDQCLAKILSNNINYKIFYYNEKIIEKKEKENKFKRNKNIYIKENLSKRKENKFKRNKNENIFSIKDILKSKKKNDLIEISKILNIKYSKYSTKDILANNLKDFDNIIEIVKNYEINKNDEINENKVKECDKINKENDSNETDSKLELNEINENLSKKTNFNYDPDLYLELFEDEEMKGEFKDDEIENNKIMKENILDQIKIYKNLINENNDN